METLLLTIADTIFSVLRLRQRGLSVSGTLLHVINEYGRDHRLLLMMVAYNVLMSRQALCPLIQH